ncbi:VOC family protein [Leeuwenhoekiella parthenopeia]|uniref:Glyoxalase n=1 Tax=Leeuwenhoekiella parthenopeia TaxID=2890320 RepID=A0ABS8GPC4_9FLAO|nr:VOC family protein [Leeuwenhoekiella parthenopeia]MCC4211616.1 glyoxalase [Leeuwenhoekiella parthenopeia]
MHIKSIRPFLGCKDFNTSRAFYRDLGFEEVVLPPKMALFKKGDFGFYLQDAYVKDWVDNTMVFLEVENVQQHLDHIKSLQLPEKYAGVRVSELVHQQWGSEFFVHDPSGILWHIGSFKK